MRLLRAWGRRALAFLGRRQHVEDLTEELLLHSDLLTAEFVARGFAPEEARRRARIQLGGLDSAKEAVRHRRSLPWLEMLVQDLRYGLRGLRRQPAFTAFMVISLGLGIGASTLVFSVLDAWLLRPLPHLAPDRLLAFRETESGPDLDDIRARCRTLGETAGVAVQPLDYTARDQRPVQLIAGLTTPDLPRVLGLQPALGRWFRADEDRTGANPVVVLTDGLWRTVFGADPNILGKPLTLSGKPYVVVGVTPPTFWLPMQPIDLWASGHAVYPAIVEYRGVHALRSFARLSPWATLKHARSEMRSMDAWLERHYPEEDRGVRRELLTMRDRVVGDRRASLNLLAVAVSGLLLIACVNFANLLLARGEVRRRELLIRGSLGAGRFRIARQLLTETLLLAALGGAVGVLLARVGLPLLTALAQSTMIRTPAAALDLRAVAFALAAAAVTAVVFGLAPALLGSQLNLGAGIKAGGRVAGDRRGTRLRRSLIATEFALAFVLLSGAGLLLRSFVVLEHVEPGFRVDQLLTARLQLPAARYAGLEEQRRFRAELVRVLNSAPGIQAGLVSELPLSGERVTHNFVVAGAPPVGRGEEPEVVTRTVSPEAFGVLGITVLRGRPFGAHDTPQAPLVAAVNEAFARRYLAGRDPVGIRVAWAHQEPKQWMTVVAVVGDVRHEQLDAAAEPAVYDAYAQTPQPWKRWMQIVVHGRRDPASLLALLERAVAGIDRDLPLTRVATMGQLVADSLTQPRLRLVLIGLFAAVALVLACNGIYGVMAFSVAQEARSFGIRLALGAQRGAILQQVMLSGLRLVVLGGATGWIGAQLVARILARFLYGISPNDPLTLAAVGTLLAAVAMVACWVPARSATRSDPLKALRAD